MNGIKYVHGQVLTFSLRALYRFGRAMAATAQGAPSDETNDHLDVMKRHIEFVQECIDCPEFCDSDDEDAEARKPRPAP